jgi:hypothetical protein
LKTPLLAHGCRHGAGRGILAQVNDFAERIARYIVAQEFPIETPVGIFRPLAGGSCLPACSKPAALRAARPASSLERLKYMLDEMKAPLVITAGESHPFGEVPARVSCRSKQLDTAPTKVEGYRATSSRTIWRM